MALDDDIRAFLRIPLFKLMEPEALRLLAFSAETKLLRAGDVLFNEGDESDGGYLVVNGALTPFGSTDGSVGAGSLIGEMALIASSPRAVTLVAAEPTTVLRITRALFRRVLEEYPQSAVRLREMIAGRVGAFTQELAAMTTYGKPR